MSTHRKRKAGRVSGVARHGTVAIVRGGQLRAWGATTVRFDLKIRTKPPGAVMAQECGWVEFAGVLRAEIVDLPRFDQRPTTPRGEDALPAARRHGAASS